MFETKTFYTGITHIVGFTIKEKMWVFFNNMQYTSYAQLAQFSVRNKSDFGGFVLF